MIFALGKTHAKNIFPTQTLNQSVNCSDSACGSRARLCNVQFLSCITFTCDQTDVIALYNVTSKQPDIEVYCERWW
jgi:hypothetical protein